VSGGYRERPDAQRIIAERLAEAYALEAQAMRDKATAEVELRVAESEREARWHTLGAHVNLERHLIALASAYELAQKRLAEPPASDAETEAARAAFSTSRGVDPGPSLASSEARSRDVRDSLEEVRRDIAAARAAIEAADERVAAVRVRIAAAAETLAEATRARVAVQSEHVGQG